MAKKKSTVPSGKAAQSISSTNKVRMIEHCLLNIFTNMEVLKTNNNGKLPFGAISCAVHDVQELVPWATTQKVKYFLRKIRLSGDTSSYQHEQIWWSSKEKVKECISKSAAEYMRVREEEK